MRIRGTVAVLTGTLALLSLTSPVASAAEGNITIKNVVVNEGRSPIVVGTTLTKAVPISVTASDDSGISKNYTSAELRRGPLFDLDYSVHGAMVCTASSRTTSTCKRTLHLSPRSETLRNSFAGIWNVNVQVAAKDGDMYSGDYTVVRVVRASRLTVNASPEPVKKGRTITVTGNHTRANWETLKYAGYGSQYVALQFRKKGSSTYHTVKTVKASRSGVLKTTVKASTDGYWRWNFAGTGTTASAKAVGDFVDVR